MKTSGHPQPQDMDEWMQGTETGYSADALASETDEQDQNELTTGQELNSETVIQMPDSYVIKWCSWEVLVTIRSILFLTLSYCVDMINLIMYLYKQKIALFCSYLLCTALPAIFIHCFITKRLEPNCRQPLSIFLFSPWQLLSKYIQVCGQNTPEKNNIKHNMTVVTVVECLFKAVPQLYIQSTAWWTGGDEISPFFFEGSTEIIIKTLIKTLMVAFNLLGEFSDDMPIYWKCINCIPVALVIGARMFVFTSLFALQDSWWWICFLPPSLGAFASWLISGRTGLRRTVEACSKTLLLPPADMAGTVPSALYVIAYGLAVYAGKNCTIFVLYIVLLCHIVGGILWKCVLYNKYKCD